MKLRIPRIVFLSQTWMIVAVTLIGMSLMLALTFGVIGYTQLFQAQHELRSSDVEVERLKAQNERMQEQIDANTAARFTQEAYIAELRQCVVDRCQTVPTTAITLPRRSTATTRPRPSPTTVTTRPPATTTTAAPCPTATIPRFGTCVTIHR